MEAIIWDLSGTLCNTKEKKLFKGAKMVLEKASQNYKQALVTTKLSDPKGRKELIKQLEIRDYFEIVKVSLKTEEVFLEICDKFKCKPEEVYVIGDGYKWGPYLKEIAVGYKLNMKTIWIDRKNTSRLKEILLGIKYWKKIEDLSELEDII